MKWDDILHQDELPVLSRWRYSPTVFPLNLSSWQLMEATLSHPAFERICPAVSLNLAPTASFLSVSVCRCVTLSARITSLGCCFFFFMVCHLAASLRSADVTRGRGVSLSAAVNTAFYMVSHSGENAATPVLLCRAHVDKKIKPWRLK